MKTHITHEPQRRLYQRSILILALFMLAILNLAPVSAQSGPTTDPIPPLDFGEDARSIVVRLDFNADGSVTESSVEVVIGYSYGRVGDPPLLKARLFDDDGDVVDDYNAWDPHWVHVHGDDHGLEILDNATGQFAFPFAADLQTFQLRDGATGDILAAVDLGPAIVFFCEENPDDAACETDISVAKTDSVDPAFAGGTFDYTIEVTNNGLNPAQSVQVVDTLPAEVTYVSDSLGDCVEDPAGVLTCDLGKIGAGDSVSFTVTVLVAADVVFNNGGPLTITNDVEVENLAGSDPIPANNSDSEDTEVVASADLAIAGFEVVNPPIEIVALVPTDITLRTTAANYGPSAPIDAHLTTGGSASVDATVTPASIESDVLALALNELRPVDNIYTIECSSAHAKTFSFTGEIEPLHPEDSDPDLSNNNAAAELTIECAIPVEVDIRPGNPRNPINLGSKGVFQVAIMSNPDFSLDATTIDPATINLAGASAQKLGNGRYWTIERDVNDDGWMDLIVHIETEELDLSPTDTEALLKAQTFDAIHVQGTDFVTIVPPNH